MKDNIINIDILNDESIILDIKDNSLLDIDIGNFVDSGEKDYNRLINKPKINNVLLIENRTSEELKLQEKMNEITNQEIDDIIFG